MRALCGAVGALLLAVVALHGCTAMKSGDDRGPSTPLLDAGTDEQGGSTCTHHGPPPRPDVDASGGSLDLVFAVSHTYYGYAASSLDDAGRPTYRDYGFDLDDTCTGKGQDASCLEPSWANARHTDGVDGIDNAVGQLLAVDFADNSDNVPTTETYADQIIRVRGYSGGADDDQVDVALYDGFGLAPRAGGATGLRWDGTDPWMILPDTLAPPADGGTVTDDFDPLFHDDHAYVSRGMLVARLPEALLPTGLPLAPSSLQRVEQVVLAGKLVRVGSLWELQDIRAGARERAQTLLSVAARATDDGGPPLCQTKTQYDSAKSRLCSFVDISSGPDSPSAACDALSGGSLLEAKQAVLGGIGPKAEDLPDVCPPGVDTDPCGSTGDL
jgi:hypothetical protein